MISPREDGVFVDVPKFMGQRWWMFDKGGRGDHLWARLWATTRLLFLRFPFFLPVLILRFVVTMGQGSSKRLWVALSTKVRGGTLSGGFAFVRAVETRGSTCGF